MLSKCSFVFLSCLPLAAQSVLRVGPGQTYVDIPPAVAAAVPGDLILIAAGSYSTFTLDRGITLRADPPGATVRVGSGAVSTAMMVAVPPGQRAHLEQLALQQPIDMRPAVGATTAGVVSFTGVSSLATVTLTDASLAMHGCDLNGFGGHGIVLNGASALSAVQCTINASSGWFSIPPSAGIAAGGSSTVHCSDCDIEGGFLGVHTIVVIGSGIALSGSARAFCVDSSIRAYQFSPGSPYGVGIDNQSSQPVTIERCAVLDSLGAANSWNGAVQAGLVLGLSTPTSQGPVRGGVFQLDFRSRAGLPIVAHAAFGLGVPVRYPLLAQPDWGFVTNSVPIVLMLANAQGQATLAVSLPNSAWLQDVPLWFAGWTELALPVQMSPVLGGLIR
ncbi:MAG: hypothetical protein KDC98_10885 [Planctomycetes bacterium]|nr:hypothetical protein [Planctomycetota bacterium]